MTPAPITRAVGERAGMSMLRGTSLIAEGLAGTKTSTLPALGGARAGGDLRLARRLHALHVLVALGGEPQRVVAELDRRILRRVVGRLAGRQAFDDRVVVGIAEERDG